VEALDDGFERLAFDVLHDEVVFAAGVDADVVDGDDVRVLELADHADLVDEARQAGGVAGAARAEAFDGDEALDVVVAGAVDFADAAFAEELLVLVAVAVFGVGGGGRGAFGRRQNGDAAARAGIDGGDDRVRGSAGHGVGDGDADGICNSDALRVDHGLA